MNHVESTSPEQFSIDAYVAFAARNVSYAANQIWTFAATVIRDLTKLVKSTDNLDTTLRCIIENVSLADLVERAAKVARPILDAFGTVRDVIATSRVFNSLRYVIGGDLVRDLMAGKVLSIISEAAFLVARGVEGAFWGIRNKILNVEWFAHIGSKLAEIPVFATLSANLPKIGVNSFVSGMFGIALAPLAIGHIQQVANGRDVPYHLVELMSHCSDIALCVLGVIGDSYVLAALSSVGCPAMVMAAVTNPYLLGTLAVVAATTSVVAIFCNPANATVK